MMQRTGRVLAGLVLVGLGAGIVMARAQNTDAKTTKAADVTGAWTGNWGLYSPDPDMNKALSKAPRLQLDCKVTAESADRFSAVFEGECGRPYKYTIKMDGRKEGNVVLFKGTVDLGKEDGGVYDWIGRANDKEFVGFYTSQKYTGTFLLKRGQK